MINSIFDFCVWLLVVSAEALGMTYKAINVWVFVILWPILTLVLFGIIIIQHLKIRKLRSQSPTSNLQPLTSNFQPPNHVPLLHSAHRLLAGQ